MTHMEYSRYITLCIYIYIRRPAGQWRVGREFHHPTNPLALRRVGQGTYGNILIPPGCLGPGGGYTFSSGLYKNASDRLPETLQPMHHHVHIMAHRAASICNIMTHILCATPSMRARSAPARGGEETLPPCRGAFAL